jgi:hypothetical protein
VTTLTNGDAMTRAQLLKFDSMWSDRDRDHIAEDIEALGGVTFTYANKGWDRSVVVRTADGTEVMTVAAGLIYYGTGITRPGSEHMESHGGHVWRTSRNGKGSGQSKTAPDPTGGNAMCDDCFLHHPEGECDR